MRSLSYFRGPWLAPLMEQYQEKIMTDTPQSPALWKYLVVLLVSAGATAGIAYLLFNIYQRKEEGKQHFFKLVELDEDTIDPALWGKNFPRQYDGYKKTTELYQPKVGGSEVIDRLEADPNLKKLFAGYAFSIDFRKARGHAYMLEDQENTERVKQKKQPGACLHCHASVMPTYRQQGDGDEMKGFLKVCGMDWQEAHTLVNHPISCIDCHEPKTAGLRVSRPAFKKSIVQLAEAKEAVPFLPSIEKWRQGDRSKPYDVNALATRQEMRTFVCAQCHVEYYFAPKTKELIYPWAKGLNVDRIEEYYDEIKFTDWTHSESGANLLKAQHPEFEMWSQGIHARSGVSCADCHMPYQREGAVKISDHHVRSPLRNLSRACQTCHRSDEVEIQERVRIIQDRTKSLLKKGETAVVDLIASIQRTKKRNGAEERIKKAQEFQRKAQFRIDYIISENSLGFHAPQESARILGDAIDYARQGQMILRKEDEEEAED